MQDAAPNEGVSLDIYGMRLVELAELAFPSDKECARHLCERYLSTIPPSITNEVQQCERQLRTTRREPRHLAFVSIRELAKDLQKSISKSHSVRFMSIADAKSKSNQPHQEHAADDQSVVWKSQSGWVASNKGKFTQHWRSPPQNHRSQSAPRTFATSDRTSTFTCNYCKKPGHIRRDYWRASKSCLICGRSHEMTACPRFDPNHRRKAQTQTNNALN